MSIDSLGVHIGSLYLRFYGLIIISGAMAGSYLAAIEARRRRLAANHVWDLLAWVLIGGIIGARLYHVITPPPSMVAAGLTTAAYFSNPIKIPEVWESQVG